MTIRKHEERLSKKKFEKHGQELYSDEKSTALHVSMYSGTIHAATSSNEIHFLRWFKINFDALKIKLEQSIRSWTL